MRKSETKCKSKIYENNFKDLSIKNLTKQKKNEKKNRNKTRYQIALLNELKQAIQIKKEKRITFHGIYIYGNKNNQL